MRFHIFTFIAILLIGCNVEQKSKTMRRPAEVLKGADSTKHIILNESEIQSTPIVGTSQYAILSVNLAKPVLGYAQQITLDEKELFVIECATRKSVALYNRGRGAFLIDLKKYKRQYFPGITVSGNREVWVRCISEDVIESFNRLSTPYDWRKDNIVINDSGDNVFSLIVNLSTLKTYGFVTSGSETL